jgi:type IV pilus assembly protein PilM
MITWTRNQGPGFIRMAKKLSSVLGIDIGSQQIKVCEIRTQGKQPVVTALGIIATPEGAVDHQGIYNPEAVGAALKQVLAESGASSSSAVVSIAGQASVLVRTLEVPKMNAAELREHMQWEINRNIPFAESNVVSDFKPLGDDDPNSPNMDVVMAIAPQSAIDTTITVIKKAGRQMGAIDVEPLSMARVFRQNYDDLAEKTVCIVDIGAKTSAINIYHGSKLLMPRQIPLGGEMFTKAIADAYTLGLVEAESLKIERAVVPEDAADLAIQAVSNPFDIGGGNTTQEFQTYNPFSDSPVAAYVPDAPLNPFATDDGYNPVTGMYEAPAAEPVEETQYLTPVVDTTPEPVSPTLSDPMYLALVPILDEFVAEVRRSIDYYRSRGGTVDIIEMTGGGAKLKGLDTFVSKSMGIPCDAFDPLRRLNLSAKKVTPDFVDAHRLEFAIAVGNGLHIFFD